MNFDIPDLDLIQVRYLLRELATPMFHSYEAHGLMLPILTTINMVTWKLEYDIVQVCIFYYLLILHWTLENSTLVDSQNQAIY